MRRLLFAFILSVLILATQANSSYAAILYSNDFITSYSGYWTFFGTCSSTNNGLSCGNGAQGVYTTELNNLACVYGDFTVTPGAPQQHTHQLMLWENTDPNSLGKGAIFYIPINGNFRLGNYPLSDIDSGVPAPTNGTHTYGLCKNGDKYTTYIDKTQIQSETFTGRNPNQIGFQLQNNATLTNFTATDTLPAQHNVPLFKQGVAPYTNGDPVWEGEEFDHANAGQFRCGKTMAQCGCSTTSIAMVLKHHGIDTLPDGSELTPGTLNIWLKNNHGYARNAGVIWSAAAALTKKAKSKNPNFQYDALEYSRGHSDQTKLRTDLENNIPNILEVPGHFIVGTEVDGNTFTINDPYYARTSLTAYNNTYLSTRRYVPSHTDVSYITLYVDPDVDIKLTDSTGNTLGEEEIEYEVNDPTSTQTPSTPVPSLKVISYAKPATETYKITVSSTKLKQYQIDVSVIDQEGDNTQLTFEGFVDKNAQNTFTLNYNKQTVNITAFQKNVTFESTSADIQEAEKLKQLNKVLGLALKTSLETAQKQLPKNKKLAVKLLETGKKLLEESRRYGQLISKDAYEVIHYDFVTLINKYK